MCSSLPDFKRKSVMLLAWSGATFLVIFIILKKTHAKSIKKLLSESTYSHAKLVIGMTLSSTKTCRVTKHY